MYIEYFDVVVTSPISNNVAYRVHEKQPLVILHQYDNVILRITTLFEIKQINILDILFKFHLQRIFEK
jgi:hypothetical protein